MRQGWICTRCQASLSPDVKRCECSPVEATTLAVVSLSSPRIEWQSTGTTYTDLRGTAIKQTQ